MRIIQAKNYDDMSFLAANFIAAQVTLKPASVLGLATGSTPIGTYKALIGRYEEGTADFSAVTTFNLDEYRGLTPDNVQSYHYFMQQNLFSHINIPEGCFHLPKGSNPDAEEECRRYEASIADAGGIDLQLLGLGPNGHIGFNEPADAFTAATHCTGLTESTIEANKRFFAHIDDVPREAYTMGIGTIMQAKRILLIVSGEGKASILREALFGPITPRVPASILQLHRHVTVIADADALSLCKIG